MIFQLLAEMKQEIKTKQSEKNMEINWNEFNEGMLCVRLNHLSSLIW